VINNKDVLLLGVGLRLVYVFMPDPHQEKPYTRPDPEYMIDEIPPFDLSPQGGDENKWKNQQHQQDEPYNSVCNIYYPERPG
jgi:hypothetical protein